MSQNIEILEPTQKLSLTTQPQNWIGAMEEFGRSTNMLGELGASVALNASIQYNKMQGEKLGLNPQGDILPPITAADKAFAEGYIAQSNATLSLQANKMMLEGQLDLEKSYQLSPGMIQSYSSNMQQGLEQIIKQAPTQLQNDLRNNFNQLLLQQTGSLTKQYISQSKARETEQAKANLSLQLRNINDRVMAGDEAGADEIRKRIATESEARVQTGMYSPTTGQTAKDSADTAYYTAREIKNAEQAIREKRLPEYLDSIAMSNVQGRGPSESDAIKANVYNWANKVQAMRQQNQSLLMTEARNQIANGTFNDIAAAQYQATLDPINYFNLMTQFSVSQKKAGVTDAIVQAITSNPENNLSYVGASKKQINKAFDQLVQARVTEQNGKESEDRSMLNVAASIPRTIPRVVDSINAGLSSGNPQQLERWGNFYYELKEQNPTAVMGVSDENLAVFNLYKKNLNNPTYKNDPNLAASEALRQVYGKDQTQIENNARGINSYFNDIAKTPEGLSRWASKISGLSDSLPIFNRSGFNIDMQNQFKSFMYMTNNNREASQELLQDYVAGVYGTTTVNGNPEVVQYPVGKMIGLEFGADGLIQYDATKQLEQQFKEHENLFNEGKVNYYYRIKNQPDLQQYLSVKQELKDKGLLSTTLSAMFKGVPDKELIAKKELVNSFETPKPIIVEQVGKSGVIKEMQLFIQPSPNISMSSDGGTIGGWLPMAIDSKTGMPITLRGYFGPGKQTPVYNPNKEWIRSNYMRVNGIINKTWAQLQQEKEYRAKWAEEKFRYSGRF